MQSRELVAGGGVVRREKRVSEDCNIGLGDCGPVGGNSGGDVNCGVRGLKLETYGNRTQVPYSAIGDSEGVADFTMNEH